MANEQLRFIPEFISLPNWFRAEKTQTLLREGAIGFAIAAFSALVAVTATAQDWEKIGGTFFSPITSGSANSLPPDLQRVVGLPTSQIPTR